ncbi:hypothetical protein B6E66_14965 [Streptomyces maremycinicus]|nr:hypothetical protein B6E66_14965 [Streptomyces sp. B9173]
MRTRQAALPIAASGPLRGFARSQAREVAHDVRAADGRRAAPGSGTTRGAAAADAHLTTVDDRAAHLTTATDRTGLVRARDGGRERDLTAVVGRTPTLHAKIDSAAVADREAARGAGAGRIP